MALVRGPQLVKYQDLCALDSAIVGSNELRLASWSMPLSVKASINRDSGLSNETGRDRDGWAASYESAFFRYIAAGMTTIILAIHSEYFLL